MIIGKKDIDQDLSKRKWFLSNHLWFKQWISRALSSLESGSSTFLPLNSLNLPLGILLQPFPILHFWLWQRIMMSVFELYVGCCQLLSRGWLVGVLAKRTFIHSKKRKRGVEGKRKDYPLVGSREDGIRRGQWKRETVSTFNPSKAMHTTISAMGRIIKTH